MDRQVHHRQDMESHQDSRVLTVLVVMECRVMPVVQGMGSMEVIEVAQVWPFADLFIPTYLLLLNIRCNTILVFGVLSLE